LRCLLSVLSALASGSSCGLVLPSPARTPDFSSHVCLSE